MGVLLISITTAQAAAHKQVFLYFDYMASNGMTTAPAAGQIQTVVEVFAKHEIDLIIDPVNKALPLFQWMYFPMPGFLITAEEQLCTATLGAVNFGDLKTQYYQKRRPNEHYVIVGRAKCASTGAFQSVPRLRTAKQDAASYLAPDLMLAFSRINFPLGQGSGFMCDEDLNYKPNYISVMNYLFSSGVHTTDSPASTTGIPGDCPRVYQACSGWTGIDDPSLLHLDCSEQALPMLDATNVNE